MPLLSVGRLVMAAWTTREKKDRKLFNKVLTAKAFVKDRLKLPGRVG